MSALAFWKAVVQDKSNFLERVIALLEESGFAYCVIGGVAVNAYAEVVISRHLDLVVPRGDLSAVRSFLAAHFEVSEEPGNLLVELVGSGLQVRIFEAQRTWQVRFKRRGRADVGGICVPVASARASVRFTSERATDATTPAAKRMIDLYHVSRLVEAIPALEAEVPARLRSRLLL